MVRMDAEKQEENMIDMPPAIFSNEEVREFLEADGYVPNTPLFEQERNRRYFPCGGGWAEQDSWLGDRRQNNKVT